jgi:hypothetical protein
MVAYKLQMMDLFDWETVRTFDKKESALTDLFNISGITSKGVKLRVIKEVHSEEIITQITTGDENNG